MTLVAGGPGKALLIAATRREAMRLGRVLPSPRAQADVATRLDLGVSSAQMAEGAGLQEPPLRRPLREVERDRLKMEFAAN